jgi:DNA-binding IclR family transcriptional regulator
VLAVVELMVSRPGQSFTLAEVSRRLGVHKQSCHSMLAALTAAGWLVRHPTRKTYRLGPALVRVGRAASGESPVLDFAHDTMQRLADELDAKCLLLEWEGDRITLIDAATPRGLPLAPLSIGQEFPFRAPFGALFAAWSGDEAFGRWTSSLDHDVDTFRDVLGVLRQRGFDVRLEVQVDALLGHLRRKLVEGVSDPALMEQLVSRLLGEVYELGDIDDAATYDVTGIDAAVVGEPGRPPTYVLGVSYRGVCTLTGRDVRAIGMRLVDAATELGRSLGL